MEICSKESGVRNFLLYSSLQNKQNQFYLGECFLNKKNSAQRNQCEKKHNNGDRHIPTRSLLGNSSHNKLLCSSLSQLVLSKSLIFIYTIFEYQIYNRYMPEYTKRWTLMTSYMSGELWNEIRITTFSEQLLVLSFIFSKWETLPYGQKY